MGYELVSLDVDLSAETRREIEAKVGKLDKYLARVPEENFFLRVRLSKNQKNPRWTDALVDLALGDHVLIGSDSASTPAHAVHLAVIHLETQLEERKGRAMPYTW